MKATKVAFVLAALLAGIALPARAENWVFLSSQSGLSYDEDSVFVDAVTGYIVYNSATDTDGDGTFLYSAIALDCRGERYFVLGDVAPDSKQNVVPGWLMDPSRVRPLRKGSGAQLTAELLCPSRSLFRTGTID